MDWSPNQLFWMWYGEHLNRAHILVDKKWT